MKATTTHPLMLFFILLISAPFASAQMIGSDEYIFPPETLYFYDGTVTLNNNEVLTGAISLNLKTNKTYFTVIDDGTSIRYIPNTEIAQIALINKNNTALGTESVFEKLGDGSRLYRRIAKGSVAVYDSSSRPFEGNMVSGVFIKDDNKVHSIFNFWTSGAKQDLLNYINKRDNTKYKRSDFKSVTDLIAYAAR